LGWHFVFLRAENDASFPRGKLKYKNQTHNLLTHQELTCKSPRTRLFQPLFESTCRVLLPLTISFVWGKKKTVQGIWSFVLLSLSWGK